MKVLDANFLIDYLNGVDDTAAYLLTNEREEFVLPAPAYAEVLAGEGNAHGGNVEEAKADLSWGEVYATDADTAEIAATIAEEIGPEGPHLTGMDALIAAVGRQLGAPVVTADGDLTHPETKRIIEVETYRE